MRDMRVKMAWRAASSGLTFVIMGFLFQEGKRDLIWAEGRALGGNCKGDGWWCGAQTILVGDGWLLRQDAGAQKGVECLLMTRI